MRFAGKAGAWDKSTIKYNDEITLSGIHNDPDDGGAEHGDPEYILNLVKRIVTVSVETVANVNDLPPLQIRDPQ